MENKLTPFLKRPRSNLSALESLIQSGCKHCSFNRRTSAKNWFLKEPVVLPANQSCLARFSYTLQRIMEGGTADKAMLR